MAGLSSTSFNKTSCSPGRQTKFGAMAMTGSAFNQTNTSAFFNEGSLLGNLDDMSQEQLKERLIVAETLMRKLYNRNKDIETYHR